MEWTNELIFEFLDLYQREPILWNFMAPEHKNKIDAYDAWKRIQSQLKDGNVSIKDIKKKRDNLMSTYRRQRTKVRESMETANGTEDVFKPEWPFYDIMANFLDDVYRPRKRKSSEDLLDLLDTEEVEDEEDVPDTHACVSGTSSSFMDRTMEQTFKAPKTLEKNKFKKSRVNAYDEMKNPSDESHPNLKNMSKSEKDTSSLYCDLLCYKLRSLQESTRDIAMMEIDKIMFTLKQQDNLTRNFPNTVYQNIMSLISQQMNTSQPPPQCKVSLPSPGYSHLTNSQPSPEYTPSSNSQSSPGNPSSSSSQPPVQNQNSPSQG